MANHQLTFRRIRVPRPSVPSNENILSIIKAADEDPQLHDLRDAVRVIVNTGICFTELANLRWSDVDSESGRACVGTPRLHRRERIISRGPLTLESLAALLARNQTSEYILSDSCRGSFRMSRLLRTTAKSIGVDPVPFSALRRVFACRLVGSGAPISAVMHCPGRRDCDGGLEIWLSPDYHCEQVSLNLAKIGEL